MSNPQRFAEVEQRLGAYGYDVQPDGDGFYVRHRINQEDVSYARHLDDLADLAELVEWATRRFERTREA